MFLLRNYRAIDLLLFLNQIFLLALSLVQTSYFLIYSCFDKDIPPYLSLISFFSQPIQC